MSIEQITAKAEKMGLSTSLMDLLAAAFEAGKTEGVRDAAQTLEDDGQDDAVGLLTANYAI